jgi:AcrR family transcriptional regulator
MDEERSRSWIIERITEWIFERGVNSFTMDDVAAETGVSKKTLYRLIPSRNELILQVVGRKMDMVEEMQNRILENKELDFPRKIGAMARVVSDAVSRFRVNAVRDMAKASPELWETIRRRRERILSGMFKVLEEGRSAGMVRTDIPPEFLALFFQQVLDAVVTPAAAVAADMKLNEILDSALSLIFTGMLTQKGRDDVTFSGRKQK